MQEKMFTRQTLECLAHVCTRYVFTTCINLPTAQVNTVIISMSQPVCRGSGRSSKSSRVAYLISGDLNPGPSGSGSMCVTPIPLHRYNEGAMNMQQTITTVQSCPLGHVSAAGRGPQQPHQPSYASLNNPYPYLCPCGSLCLKCSLSMPSPLGSLNPFCKVNFRCHPQASPACYGYSHGWEWRLWWLAY